MIFISLGTERFPFKRACKYIYKLIKEGFNDKIVLQYGKTPCDLNFSNLEKYDFVPYSKFIELIDSADVIIMHGGVGSFLDTVARGKVPVILPRKAKLGEHLDDQQMHLAKTLEKEFNAPIAYNYKQFKELITKGVKKPLKLKTYKKGLIEFLDNWVKER